MSFHVYHRRYRREVLQDRSHIEKYKNVNSEWVEAFHSDCQSIYDVTDSII